MYADKRDPVRSSDENLGRWIVGGVILLVIGAGGWYYWQKRQADKEEAPVAATQPANAPGSRIKNPIVLPDDKPAGR